MLRDSPSANQTKAIRNYLRKLSLASYTLSKTVGNTMDAYTKEASAEKEIYRKTADIFLNHGKNVMNCLNNINKDRNIDNGKSDKYTENENNRCGISSSDQLEVEIEEMINSARAAIVLRKAVAVIEIKLKDIEKYGLKNILPYPS